MILVTSLIETFIENWIPDLERLQRAVDEGDAECARKVAHRMKSSSANVGALRLSARCADIEKGARNGDVLNESLAMLEAEYDKVLAVFGTKQLRAA